MAEATVASSQFLTFSVDEEVLAVDIAHVREIIQQSSTTVVPLMPTFVRGVINLRGAVVPVIDLSVRLGRGRTVAGKKTCIVVLNLPTDDDHRADLGMLVDSVSEVIDIQPGQVEPPPEFGTAIAKEMLHGIGKVQGRFISLLAPERALNVDVLASLIDASTAPRTAPKESA